MVCQRLLKVLGFATLICLVHANWKAIRTTTKVETFCSDVDGYISWTPPNNSNCNITLQQVFKLLLITDDRILIGSTECVYFLDHDLQYINSTKIRAANVGDCEGAFDQIGPIQKEFQCKNYIVYAHPNGSSYRVCGTYNKIDPTCWICDEMGCDSDLVVNFMPRYPTSNFTVTRATDGSDFYYIGSLESFDDKDYQLSKVEVTIDANRFSAAVETDTTNERYIWDRTSFVGSIERGAFIYFFYRERAREYSNIGNIVYSRVARVCKNDVGGAGILGGNFVTFLKTRLMCSVGSGYPFIFNEIQDVFQSPSYDTDNLIYGLFTNPNAGLSSTAICRYDMSEIDKLFNEGTRRGQPNANEQWQSISIDAEDTMARRSCSGTFPSSLYTYLRDYPLMNTNAPNCGLTTTCEDYTRESDEALAVFEGIRGQQLVVLNDNGIKVYVGTNNNTVYEASINNSAVIITKQINIKADISMLTDQIQNKWPLAVTYLEVNGDDIIGTLDNMVFKFTPDTMEVGQILDRSPSVYEVYFPQEVRDAKVEIFKLFEGPSGSDITSSFSGGLENYSCSQNTFKSSGSGKREFLAVLCEISGNVERFTGHFIVASQTNIAKNATFDVTVNIDNSTIALCDASEVNKYDHQMAEYRYKFKEWLIDHVTCEPGTKDTCPSASYPGKYKVGPLNSSK